ncbi:MAG TPA: sodium-dependent transporter [Epulopiscium sp.]|nr:sodium-dependent transporter [Candidatus Epulonipiscium sp.]
MGVLAAAVGSAVGLGNIWKFTYIAGKYGGAAFILVYLICVAVIGIPVMLVEFSLGRRAGTNAAGVFKIKKTKFPWQFGGYLAVATSFIILSFYAIIAGWLFSYIGRSLTGHLFAPGHLAYGEYFETVSSSTAEPLIGTVIVLMITATVCLSGVKDGIEKYTKILMPILFALLAILMVRSLSLPGSWAGMEFLFKPDFSKITSKAILEALGHAFYSLSLGMGIILTYGSYIDKTQNLGKLTVQIAIADTVIALMSGIVIFPAVFAFNMAPNAGPGLIFITLPAVFEQMQLGHIVSVLFFLLIAIAAITSTISLMEVSIAFVMETFKVDRKKATLGVTLGLFVLAIPSVLSFSVWKHIQIGGRGFFDLFDFIASNIFLPVGGIVVSIYAGWVIGMKNIKEEVTNYNTVPFRGEKFYTFIIKYIAPIAIFVIFLFSTGVLTKLVFHIFKVQW